MSGIPTQLLNQPSSNQTKKKYCCLLAHWATDFGIADHEGLSSALQAKGTFCWALSVTLRQYSTFLTFFWNYC